MYALVEIKGKQYKVEKDGLVKVDKFGDNKDGDKLEFDTVMLIASDEGKVKIGTPYVKGVKVDTVVSKAAVKDKKVKVLKFKRRKGYERSYGHRQQYTWLKVNGITGA